MILPKCSPEELERLKKREPIAHDDATALCTVKGWELYQKNKPTAVREAPVPNAKFWRASVVLERKDGTKYLWSRDIECERWVDARAFARMMQSHPLLIVVEIDRGVASQRRWQVRWAGAAIGTHGGLYMVARMRSTEPFVPARVIDFGVADPHTRIRRRAA